MSPWWSFKCILGGVYVPCNYRIFQVELRQNKKWTDNIEEWTGKSFAETQAPCTQPPGLERAGPEVLPEAPPRLFAEFREQASNQVELS